MTSSSSSSPFEKFIGTAYGEVLIEQGLLSLYDNRIDESCYLPFITDNRKIAEKLMASVGERVRLTFELNELSHRGYVIPRQMERCPEEYAPPRMKGLIFTGQPGCGLQPYGECECPELIGHLMQSHANGELMRPQSFCLDPLDFMMLAGSLDDASGIWMSGLVIHAQLELMYKDCLDASYKITRLISLKDQTLWEREMCEGVRLALPGMAKPDDFAPTTPPTKRQRRVISTRLRYEILRRDGHRCVDCGASAQDDPLVRLEIDHRIPVSKGGTNDPDNLQTLCWACNNGKSDRIDHKLNLSDPWEIAC